MKALDTTDQATIMVHVPMKFTIRGGRKTILSDAVPAPSQPRIENALLKALARAHRWRRQIENGEYATITELAKAEKVNESYACRILRLSLLAPSIVTEILDGRHELRSNAQATYETAPRAMGRANSDVQTRRSPARAIIEYFVVEIFAPDKSLYQKLARYDDGLDKPYYAF